MQKELSISEKRDCLQKMKALLEIFPDPKAYEEDSKSSYDTLGKGAALLAMAKPSASMTYQMKLGMAGIKALRESILFELRAMIVECVQMLEFQLPSTINQIYPSGALFDIYRDVKQIVVGSKTDVLIVDPYLNDEIYELYLEKVLPQVNVRLLTNWEKMPQTSKAISKKYEIQKQGLYQIRHSKQIHDRVIFIDSSQCYIIGQSIKDAGKKTTYITPISADLIPLKQHYYEELWAEAQAVS